jgi:hypothetical protein
MIFRVYINYPCFINMICWLHDCNISHEYNSIRSQDPTNSSPNFKKIIKGAAWYYIFYLDFESAKDALLFRLRWPEYVVNSEVC